MLNSAINYNETVKNIDIPPPRKNKQIYDNYHVFTVTFKKNIKADNVTIDANKYDSLILANLFLSSVNKNAPTNNIIAPNVTYELNTWLAGTTFNILIK